VLSEHKHCDNAAINVNSTNTRSTMEAISAGKHGYGDKERRAKYWARLGCWISLCYGPFTRLARFETDKPFIFLIFKFFLGHS
jgi:hypothetical protein